MAREHSGGLYRVNCSICSRAFLANKKQEAINARDKHEKKVHGRK